MAIYESFLHFYIYLKTENRECIRPNIHKTCILPKVGNMTLLPNPGKPGFYGVGLPGRVIWCQPWFSQRIINDWNSLPEGAVLAKDVNEFKSKIDQHWNHEVMYDY